MMAAFYKKQLMLNFLSSNGVLVDGNKHCQDLFV